MFLSSLPLNVTNMKTKEGKGHEKCLRFSENYSTVYTIKPERFEVFKKPELHSYTLTACGCK